MPASNIYFQKNGDFRKLNAIASKLKKFLAEKLTCGGIRLTPEEVSIRFVEVKGKGMIGRLEIEINAHLFPDRVKNQDKICLDVVSFIRKETPSLKNVKAWLQLSELGHRW